MESECVPVTQYYSSHNGDSIVAVRSSPSHDIFALEDRISLVTKFDTKVRDETTSLILVVFAGDYHYRFKTVLGATELPFFGGPEFDYYRSSHHIIDYGKL